MKKILLLGSQHGNELLGEKLYEYIKAEEPNLKQHIDYLLANSKARRHNVRFIESDMNRSYNGKRDTYEERRAQKIVRIIESSDYDLVLDLHTTTCLQPPCMIMQSISSETIPFIQASSIKNIVIMGGPLINSSINGIFSKAISIELNKEITEAQLNELSNDMRRFIDGEEYAIEREVYRIDELLLRTEITPTDAKKLENFVLSKHGFYPILVGENSYKKNTEYLGFKAYERHLFKV